MAYIGTNPANSGTGLFSQDTFTGDGSTVAFDLTNAAPDGGGNELQVFVDNVRQQEGSSNAYTLGFDGSSVFKRITFTAAPAASAAIYVLNPGTKNVQQISTISDNTVTAAKVQANAITVAKLASTLDLSSNTVTLPNLSVATAKIAADAIDATKLADDAISEEHLDVTSITGHTELAEEANNSDVLLVFDTSTNTLKKIQRSNLVQQAPIITSVSPTSVVSGDGTGNHTFIINGSGFTSASASLVNNSGSNVSFDTVTVNSSIKITGVIAKSSLLNSGEPFDVKVTAANGLAATLANQINIDASPAYVTAAGTLGTVLNGLVGSTTLEVVASDPESAGNVTYEIQSGTLPAGASGTTLHENGVSKFKISGFNAVVSNTTSNFVLRAVDAASNTTSRAFSITVNGPQSTSFTTSGTFSVPTGLTSVDVLVVGGGGHGGYQHAGGGGAGGLIFMPGFTVSPGSTITVTVGSGGTPSGGSPGGFPNMTGQDSAFGTLTAKGGGVGQSGCSAAPNGDGPATAGGGGSGGGAGYQSSNNGGGAASQPTQPGNSGAYGFGRDGGNTTGSGGQRAGAGGGGAQAAGGQSTNQAGGNGGAGKAYTIADGTTSVYYAGGGGGSNHAAPSTAGSGGQGGGGAAGSGPNSSATNATDGQANKGGGGGAAHYAGQQSCFGSTPLGINQGNGGKGIVIVRF